MPVEGAGEAGVVVVVKAEDAGSVAVVTYRLGAVRCVILETYCVILWVRKGSFQCFFQLRFMVGTESPLSLKGYIKTLNS